MRTSDRHGTAEFSNNNLLKSQEGIEKNVSINLTYDKSALGYNVKESNTSKLENNQDATFRETVSEKVQNTIEGNRNKKQKIAHSSNSVDFNQTNNKRILVNEDLNTNHDSEKLNNNSNANKEYFRSALEEHNLQNMKKYGNSKQNQPFLNYGASKKSLGGLRNNFVPPWRKNDDNKNSDDDETESKLKKIGRINNIDPKLVEMINNEIIHNIKSIDWDDIVGLEYAKSVIQEAVVWPLLRPDIFVGLRRPPRGILLFGPPGTGKTLIGKCIASQSKSTFFSISASSLTSKWIGEGEKLVRALFAVAAAHQPSVIFIDEIDSLLCQRSEGEHESSRRIKTEFLVQLDGAATFEDERVLIVAATNRPQELDEAARRRLVRRLYIPLPEFEARLKLLQKLMSSVKNNLSHDNFITIANLTDGYSGADIDVLSREASMEPIRSIPPSEILSFNEDQVRPVSHDDFLVALTRVRATVSQDDLKQYIEWNKTYGSGGT